MSYTENHSSRFISLPPDFWRRLDRGAEFEGLTRNQLVETMVRACLEALEEKMGAQEQPETPEA